MLWLGILLPFSSIYFHETISYISHWLCGIRFRYVTLKWTMPLLPLISSWILTLKFTERITTMTKMAINIFFNF